MSVAEFVFLPPGVKGDRVVEHVEPNRVASFMIGCVVSCTPHCVASGASEGEICTQNLERGGAYDSSPILTSAISDT